MTTSTVLRLSASVALSLLLTACMEGRIKGGTYLSPDKEFEVNIPPLREVGCFDGQVESVYMEYVDCAVGQGDWKAEGGYSVEWYRLDYPLDSDAEFYKKSQKTLPELIATGIRTKGATDLALVLSANQTVNGHAAHQVVIRATKEGIPVYCVGTSIDFRTRIAVAYLLIPAKSESYAGPADAGEAAAWGHYPAFVDSIEDRVADIVH